MSGHGEGRPRQDGPDTSNNQHSNCLTVDDLGEAHRVGYDLGFAARGEFNAEERAREILHDLACEWAGVTRRQALANHGPAWADLVCGDDE